MSDEAKHKAQQVARWIERAQETPSPKEVLAYCDGKWPGLQPEQRFTIATIAMGMTF